MFLLVPAYRVVSDKRPLNGSVCVLGDLTNDLPGGGGGPICGGGSCTVGVVVTWVATVESYSVSQCQQIIIITIKRRD